MSPLTGSFFAPPPTRGMRCVRSGQSKARVATTMYYVCVYTTPEARPDPRVWSTAGSTRESFGRGAIGRHRIAYWGMPFLVRHYLLLVLSSISCARAGMFYPLKSSTFVRYGIPNDQEQPSCDG